MQGATIDTIDSNGYGNVTAINGAGTYELIGLTGSSGNTLNLDTSCGGLRNDYFVAGHTQVLRVPQYTDLTVPNGTSISAPSWNGVIGGVVAIFAQGSVTFGGGNIDVSGRGFRGGPAHVNGRTPGGTLVNLYRSTDAQDGGEKGEGIAGTDADLPNGRYGRGAPANGGGGGNYLRAGGGGGANGNSAMVWNGQGVMDGNAFGTMAWALDPGYMANGNQLTTSSGGGRGGYSLASNNQDARTTAPGDATWGTNQRQPVGGSGGHPVANLPASRLHMGGGGGAGDEIGSNVVGGSFGGNGGGLVLMFARDISGNGTIVANGAAGGASRDPNDGGGGGGGGGTLVVSASRNLTGVTLSANGGAGGASSSILNVSQGPGGGGGGGYIATSMTTVARTVNSGAAGQSSATAMSEFPYNGSTFGAVGQTGLGADPPAGMLYPSCVAADLVVTAIAGPGPIAPGGTALFNVTVVNNGPNPLTDARLVVQSPFAANASSYTCTATGGASCPVAMGSGSIEGPVNLPVGGRLSYAISGTVPQAMTAGMITYTLTANPPNGYGDPMPMNNMASANLAILSGNIVDLGIRVASSPLEPALDEAVSYEFTVSNQGPGTTNTQSVSFGLAAGASVASVQLGDGWNCSTASQTVTCTRSAPLAAGQTTVLRLTIRPPAGAESLSITAQVVASDGADRNALDNKVNWDVILGRSTVYAAGGGLGCAASSRGQSSTLSLLFVASALGLLLSRRRRNPSKRVQEDVRLAA